jgi:hypothetical protein
MSPGTSLWMNRIRRAGPVTVACSFGTAQVGTDVGDVEDSGEGVAVVADGLIGICHSLSLRPIDEEEPDRQATGTLPHLAVRVQAV